MKLNSISTSVQIKASLIIAAMLVTASFANAASVTKKASEKTSQNSIGIELIQVQPGEFLMGGQVAAETVVKTFPESKVKAGTLSDEYPQHRVQITKPFLLGKYEVTVGQFRQFTEETGYKTEAETDGTGGWGYNVETRKSEGRRLQFNWRNTGYPQTDRFPVVNVSYNDALAFLAWLSAKEGKHYRLPTEAEWEYVNRAGTKTLYSNANDPKQIPTFARSTDVSRHPDFAHVQDLEIRPDDPTAFPVNVGSYAPNAWGFYDMHGNAWEWVSDWHSDSYYAESPLKDPQGPSEGDVRVRRGGGWNSFPIWLRSSFRNINTPSSRCVNLGFRVAQDL